MEKKYINAIAAWLCQLDVVDYISLTDTCEGLDEAKYKLGILQQEKVVAERVLLQSCRDAARKLVDG